MRNKTALGSRGQAETSLKIEDLRANKPTCNEMMAFLVTFSAGTSVRGPETQEGARQSLKNPKALAIDVLFRIFHFLGGIFNYNPPLIGPASTSKNY
jgi:hypothetical protein